jgi:glycosyltransferase involved in cell wall biosynthesis
MPAAAVRRLRVAILARVVYPLHGYGGLQRHTYDLVSGLLDRGVEVTLITQPPQARRPNDPEADATFRRDGLTIVTVPYYTFPFAGRRGTTILDRITAYPWFGLRAGRTAARLVHSGRIDVVYGLGASALGYALARRRPNGAAAPFVFNPQGMEEFGATDPGRAPLKRIAYWPLQRAVLACAQAADRVIATDRVLVEPVLTHLRVPLASVCTIPNAIDLATVDRADARTRAAALRARAGVSGDDLLLLSVGRLEANKGFHVLVRALSRLMGDDQWQKIRWRWVIVGDGPARPVLERAIASSGLGEHALLHGRADGGDLASWYEAADLFVHPTLYEGSSLVTLEAMAHHRPVVATRAGGLPDKVFPDVNGWLVPPGSDDALADALRAAVAARGRWREMGDASRAIVERDFSWSVVLDRLLRLFDELLQAPARHAR